MPNLKNLLDEKTHQARSFLSQLSAKPDAASQAKSGDFEDYLSQVPYENEAFYLSEARFFQHEEEDYDTQYQNTIDTSIGTGVIKLLNAFHCNLDGVALEIGCGTGVVSRGLLGEPSFRLTVITDPSPKFVNITKRKLADLPNLEHKARFAILRAEDLGNLPQNQLAAIILRSVLHHVVDVPQFLQTASAALEPGGILVIEEPCSEGFILMGALAQFIPMTLEKQGKSLTPLQLQQIQGFVETMKFYVNRLADKSNCEDKHVFRVDELIKDAELAGLKTEFYPNLSFPYFNLEQAKLDARAAAKEPFSFSGFFHSYLKYCMQFDPALLDMISESFMDYCSYMDEISLNGNAPYSTGVFVFQKR